MTTRQAEHTPEPWEWDAGIIPPDGPGTYADIYVDGGETIIAQFNDEIPQGRANARRIVACVNACAGISTADIEKFRHTAPGIELERVRRQLDLLAELCKAIENLSAGWDADGSLGPKTPYWWELVARMAMGYARAALAAVEKMKGEK